jgi:hypothetical protein
MRRHSTAASPAASILRAGAQQQRGVAGVLTSPFGGTGGSGGSGEVVLQVRRMEFECPVRSVLLFFSSV